MKLPRERPLPNSRVMLDAVVSAGEVHPQRRRHVLVPVAAALLGVAVGAGATVGVLRGEQPRLAAPAAPPPTATPTPTLVGGAASVVTRAPGQSAELGHFSVTVADFRQSGDEFVYHLTVCVREVPALPGTEDGRVRVGLEAWTARTTGWRTLLESSVQLGPTTYPADRRLRVGECADGMVVATVRDTHTRVLALDYENSLGERAAWKVG